jgi:hypothetical protein
MAQDLLVGIIWPLHQNIEGRVYETASHGVPQKLGTTKLARHDLDVDWASRTGNTCSIRYVDHVTGLQYEQGAR